MGRTSDARERLISSASSLFHKKSYTAVGVADLCAAADVRKSSFYHHFSSKDELLQAVLEHHGRFFKDKILAPIFNSTEHPVRRLANFFEAFHQGLQRQLIGGEILGCPMGNLSLELATTNSALRGKVQGFLNGLRETLEATLEEAKAQGLIEAKVSVKDTALAYIMLFQGTMLIAKTYNDASVGQSAKVNALALIGWKLEDLDRA